MGKQIQTAKGLIEGVTQEGYTVYKGIPYAKPNLNKEKQNRILQNE
jgi:carboxylesterase type B